MPRHDSTDAGVPARRSGNDPRGATLEVISGPDKGRSIELRRMITLIGRAPGCDVVLGDQSTSREHGQIEQSPAGWVYTNFSDNGTWINRKQVDRKTLADGDMIAVGRQTRMRFTIEDAATPTVEAATRRRPRRSSDEREQAEQEAEEDQRREAAETPSLLKRRKTLVLLGVYLVAMLAVVIALAVGAGDGEHRAGSVELWRRDQVDNSLELDFDYQPNSRMAEQKLKQARLARQSYPQNPEGLYAAVAAYQEHIAYLGRYNSPEGIVYKNYNDTRERLVERLWELYNLADKQELARHYAAAERYYDRIQEMVPPSNPFWEHVQQRKNALPR